MDKTLSDHDEIMNPLDSLCTKHTAETYGINTPDYTLSTPCQQFGIEPSTHRDAMRDATVCMEPFRAMRSEHLIDPLSASIYQRILYIHKSGNTPADNASTAMTDLSGILLGAALDGRITAPEQRAFSNWMNHHTEYRACPFFKETYGLLDLILEDAIITADEQDMLLNVARPIVQDEHNCRSTVAMQELIGIVRGSSADKWVNEAEATNHKA